MISVLLERMGAWGHSYSASGESIGSLTLWHILKDPALSFLHRLKRERPGLEFKARIRVAYSYVNDCFWPELESTILLSNDPVTAQELLQDFVNTYAHLIDPAD